MKYRKKPVVIEAIHFTNKNDAKELCDFVGNNLLYNITSDEYYINTLEGVHHISEGDYIIKGVHGEFYPCKPDIFNETYTQYTNTLDEIIDETTVDDYYNLI